jgi:hypothetical protein
MIEFAAAFLITIAVLELVFWGITIGLLRKIWNKLKG